MDFMQETIYALTSQGESEAIYTSTSFMYSLHFFEPQQQYLYLYYALAEAAFSSQHYTGCHSYSKTYH